MLGLIAGVQFFRNATIDGVIFTVVAIAVVVDATGILPRSERTFRAPRLIVLLPVAAAVAAVLIIAPRHGVVVGILIVAIGVGAVVIAWPNRAPGDRDIWTTPTRRAGIVWSVVALAACAWELTMYLLGTFTSGGRETGPALSAQRSATCSTRSPTSRSARCCSRRRGSRWACSPSQDGD